VIALPPELGAVHVTFIVVVETVPVGAVGVLGTVGVVIDAKEEAIEEPVALLAIMVKEYGVPAVNPVTTLLESVAPADTSLARPDALIV
jgi:hypothetical protein